jgi:hypothetical protein
MNLGVVEFNNDLTQGRHILTTFKTAPSNLPSVPDLLLQLLNYNAIQRDDNILTIIVKSNIIFFNITQKNNPHSIKNFTVNAQAPIDSVKFYGYIYIVDAFDRDRVIDARNLEDIKFDHLIDYTVFEMRENDFFTRVSKKTI